MTKIDIISGFLGAGKTTLIKKLLSEAFAGQQVVLIENEFGEIGIDGGFLKESGIEIREMNSGCICCSLVGDFGTSLKEVITTYHPDRIIIEPSGVGKLSDVIKAVEGVDVDCEISLNSYTTVVDVNKCKMYLRNFGEFFENQLEHAKTIILSRTDLPKATEEKVEKAVELIRGVNKDAMIITTPIEKLSGQQILEAMEQGREEEEEICPVCGHSHDHDHDHHHDHDEECCCGHDHDHEHHHEHHHHDHDEECCCGHDHDHEHHHHHHDHDEEC
ncbi:MAG: GTP-binding protein, partial [Ruminococcus sp.]|nr:GTP-binding protein [Ruminococcus sp.]